MLRRIRSILRLEPQRQGPPPGLPDLSKADVSHLLRSDHGLSHVDWGAAAAWIERREPNHTRHPLLRRAVAAAWLNQLRDDLTSDHRRWQRLFVEGVGPLENNLAGSLADVTDRAYREIQRSLRPLRGDGPIPPIAIVALATADEYYSFIAHYHEDGEFATSGGVYINQGSEAFPMIVMPTNVKWALDATIAHELTHHSLKPMGLPLWIEEGLTQMMEERLTGRSNFRVDRDMIDRHRYRWEESGLERYFSGGAFFSSHEDEQELAYHLSQMIVRRQLSDRPEQFFAFARACRAAASAEQAAREELGCGLEDLATAVLGPGDWHGEQSWR